MTSATFRRLACMAVALFASLSVGAAEVLTQVPGDGKLAAGQVVHVDDGSCPAGQIKELTGGDSRKGISRTVRCVARPGVAAAATETPPVAAPASAKKVEFVAMGGNDCPPCVVWRAVELPKLQALPEWKMMNYHYVTKAIQTPVPSAAFFPAESRHLQPVLAEASNGWSGSPHQAIVVDGKVVDYWTGTYKGAAPDIAALVRAIHEGKPLPRATCAQLDTRTSCKKPG